MLLVYILVCLLFEGYVKSSDSHYDGKQSRMFEPWPKCCSGAWKQGVKSGAYEESGLKHDNGNIGSENANFGPDSQGDSGSVNVDIGSPVNVDIGSPDTSSDKHDDNSDESEFVVKNCGCGFKDMQGVRSEDANFGSRDTTNNDDDTNKNDLVAKNCFKDSPNCGSSETSSDDNDGDSDKSETVAKNCGCGFTESHGNCGNDGSSDIGSNNNVDDSEKNDFVAKNCFKGNPNCGSTDISSNSNGGNTAKKGDKTAKSSCPPKDFDTHTIDKSCQCEYEQCNKGWNECKFNKLYDNNFGPNFLQSINNVAYEKPTTSEIKAEITQQASPPPVQKSNEEQLKEDKKLAEQMKEQELRFSGTPCKNNLLSNSEVAVQPYHREKKNLKKIEKFKI